MRSDAPRFGVYGDDSGQICGFKVLDVLQSVLNHPRNRKKRNPPVEEGCNRKLVSCIVDGRSNATCGHRFPGYA